MSVCPGVAAAAGACLLAATGLAARAPAVAPTGRHARPPQAWLARRFLLQVLAHKQRAAYAALGPDAQARLSKKQFVVRADEVRRQGRSWGPAIELYKLGWRLGEGQPAVPFYQFTFAADSIKPRPHVLLDVTFRDSLATQPSGFGLVQRRP